MADVSHFSTLCSCSLCKSATSKAVSFNLYKYLYAHYIEDSIADKIKKIRLSYNLTRKQMAKILNCHHTTIQDWENNNILPSIKMALNICDKFSVELRYLGTYYEYALYPPIDSIRHWMSINNLSYNQASYILSVSDSTLKRLLRGKIKLSYNLFILLCTNKIIDFKKI